MAKRGETRPWLVTYVWDTGVHGKATYTDEDAARFKAAEIRRNAEAADRDVTVTVTLRGVAR